MFQVEILVRVIPNEQEVKAFREYERERKPLELLSDEDKFVHNVSVAHAANIHCLEYII